MNYIIVFRRLVFVDWFTHHNIIEKTKHEYGIRGADILLKDTYQALRLLTTRLRDIQHFLEN